jgi:hypothetical protein
VRGVTHAPCLCLLGEEFGESPGRQVDQRELAKYRDIGEIAHGDGNIPTAGFAAQAGHHRQ